MSQHAEGASARGGRSKPPRQNHGGDRSAAAGIPSFENMKDQFEGLTVEVYEREKQKHGSDHESFVQALSAETEGWNTVNESKKKKDADADKSKALKGRDAAAPAAGGQSRPEGISRAPNNGAGRGAPRPRPADAPARENRTPRVDAPAVRTPRESEAKSATAPDARPVVRTPRQNTESPKAAAAPAASAPVVIKPAAPVANKWQSGPSFVQQEKEKLAKQVADEAKAQKEAALKAEDAEKEKRQQANAHAKQLQQQQQREAPVASPKQSSSQVATASPKAAAPAPAPAAAAPAARTATGGFKMNFQHTALHPSAEVQFGDMGSSDSAQASAAFQPQEQPSGYAATYNAAEGQAQGNGDAAALNGTFMQGHAGGPRYQQQQQAKPAAHQQHMSHQLSYGGFWNPQMAMYAMGNPSMYGHMAMPMMPFPYPQGYPQQGMYGQQPHSGNYRHGKNQGHNSQSTHGGAQHPGGVNPAHHYQQQQQQQATYAAAFPAADGQEGALDATQQQHKDAQQQQQQYFQGHASQQSWQSKAAGKPGAGMVGHHPDYSAYTVPYWTGGAQSFVPQLQQQQQQQQQQHGSSASAQAWHSNP